MAELKGIKQSTPKKQNTIAVHTVVATSLYSFQKYSFNSPWRFAANQSISVWGSGEVKDYIEYKFIQKMTWTDEKITLL